MAVYDQDIFVKIVEQRAVIAFSLRRFLCRPLAPGFCCLQFSNSLAQVCQLLDELRS